MAIARAVSEGSRVYHVRVQLDSQCAMPIAARQMIKVALVGPGRSAGHVSGGRGRL